MYMGAGEYWRRERMRERAIRDLFLGGLVRIFLWNERG
jgi:hypothetical protein